MTNPLTEYVDHFDELDFLFSDFEKTAGSKAQKDLELWKRWDTNGRQPEDLEPLLKQVRPVISKASNVYAGRVNIPRPAVEAEFEIKAIDAINTYDPNRSALHTHMTNQMKAARRFITTYQNVARITEKRINRLGDYQRAVGSLQDDLGREPSVQEIADKMKQPKKMVSLLQMENKGEVPFSMMTGGSTIEHRVSEEEEVLSLLPAELSREENLVYEYLTGVGGKPKLNASAVARKLNMSPAKVSRIRSSIAKKVKKYYKG